VWKDDDGKWKHDLYEDMEEPGMQQISILQNSLPQLKLVIHKKPYVSSKLRIVTGFPLG
jgi:hypothetical protein